jgi:hypothetical protein
LDVLHSGRQLEPKAPPFAQLGSDADFAAHPFGHFPHDGQTGAGAWMLRIVALKQPK